MMPFILPDILLIRLSLRRRISLMSCLLSPVIDSTDMVVKLIKAVDRKQFGVHLDVVNLVNCPRPLLEKC